MPQFTVEAEFSLITTIEPEFYRHSFDNNEVEDFQDSSYFQSEEVRSDGGALTFTVEAEDEDHAERLAEDVVSSGHEVEDSNGLTWGVEDVSFNIERVEEPMTMTLAIERISEFLASADISPEVREAVDFILAAIPTSGAGDWAARNA